MPKNQFHVPIEQNQMVTAPGNKPLVSRPTWNPGEGRAREAELEKAREIAHQQMVEQEQKTNPNNVVLMQLLGRMDRLEEQMSLIKQVIGGSNAKES